MLQILRLPDVTAKTGLKRSSVYAAIQQKTFPKPVPIGARAVGWVATEIDEWIQQRAETRGGK